MTQQSREELITQLQAEVEKLVGLANKLFDALENRNADDYVEAVKKEYGFE